jgi:hypothetical protein
MWRFRGTPHHLDAQGDRLGLSRVLTDRARKNPEIHRVADLLGQLCERWHRSPKDESGNAVVHPADLAQIRGTLGQCEQEVEKLHALAAAAQAMADEGSRAFGVDLPERRFRVNCDFDDLPDPADLTPAKTHVHPNGRKPAKVK